MSTNGQSGLLYKIMSNDFTHSFITRTLKVAVDLIFIIMIMIILFYYL